MPIKKVGPKRTFIVLIFLFLAILATTVFVFHKERHLIPLLTFDDDEEDYGEITLTDLARILKSDQNIV